MKQLPEGIIILMADDDEDDRDFALEALEEARLANTLHFVEDGEELLAYLNRREMVLDEIGGTPLLVSW